MQPLNIQNLREDALLPFNVVRQPQTTTSNLTPNKAGVIFGTSKVLADLCGDGTSFKDALSNSVVTHFLSQGCIRAVQGTQIPEQFNYVSAGLKDFVSSSFGGMCGVVAQKATEVLSNSAELSKENTKLLKDFVLLCTFVSTQLHSKKWLAKADNLAIMQEINANPDYSVRNISSKSIKFFVDVLSGAMGSLAVSYVAPLISSQEDGYLDSAKNGALLGGVFMTAKTLTHNSLTKLYNKCTVNSL